MCVPAVGLTKCIPISVSQCTETFEVGDVDVGGAYVGGTQDKILRVADSLGIATYPVFKTGINVVEVGGGGWLIDAHTPFVRMASSLIRMVCSTPPMT
jgi:hypothetical protein